MSRSRVGSACGLFPDWRMVRSLGLSVINLLVPPGLGSASLRAASLPSSIRGASAPAGQLQARGSEYELQSLRKS